MNLRKIWELVTHKLARNMLLYALSETANRAVPFLLLPVFTRYLTPEGYGIVATFTTVVSILEILAGLSAHAAISLNFFKLTREDLAVYIGNVTLILTGSTGLILLVMQLFRGFFERSLLIPEPFLTIALLTAVGVFISQVNMTLWRVEQKARSYGIYQVAQTLLNALLSLLFVVYLRWNWQGRIYGHALSTAVFAVLSCFLLVRRGYVRFKFNKAFILDALHFSLPYVPHLLGSWIRRGIDRIIIMRLLGLAETGIYAAGYQVGAIIGLLATAFNRAWSPYLYEKLAKGPSGRDKRRLVLMTYLYFAMLVLLLLALGYLVPVVTPFLFGRAFARSSLVVNWISLASVINGMYQMVVGYILFYKKTRILASVTVLTAILHAVVCYILIRLNGSIGAAQASVVSAVAMFLTIWFLSNRVYPMPWFPFKKHFKVDT